MNYKLENLIQIMKAKRFLTKDDVEKAIRNTPRQFFVPVQHSEDAYEDKPIETKKLQTISQPSVVARMTEWLNIKSGMKILEVGTGSGWQSALIAELAQTEVYTIEKHIELVEFAKQNLKKAKITNVRIVHGDGTLGLPEEAPFDRIIITAACEKIPRSLIEQVREGGLIIAPIGKHLQKLTLFQKTKKGVIQTKSENGYVFVPLVSNCMQIRK